MSRRPGEARQRLHADDVHGVVAAHLFRRMTQQRLDSLAGVHDAVVVSMRLWEFGHGPFIGRGAKVE